MDDRVRSPYHAGERAVQERAGVRATAVRLGGIIGTALPPPAYDFLARATFVIVGASDVGGRMWASLLTGAPGVLLRAESAQRLLVTPAPTIGGADPEAGADVGVLVIDLMTRRRLRVNGVATRAPGGGFAIDVRQAYWNCPKYIQQRLTVGAPTVDPGAAATWAATSAATSDERSALSEAERAWIASADTCFIASRHPTAGTDASHRGGAPGFVRVTRGEGGEDVLTFPDYPGNSMFNTLGNLAVDPVAGLLFVDFARGATLQLTGTAAVVWEPEVYAAWPGAERAVRFRVGAVRAAAHATALRWQLLERSPFNPPVTPSGPGQPA